MELPCTGEVENLPSSELHQLQRYLEMQFEKQTQLMLDLTLEVRWKLGASPPLLVRESRHSTTSLNASGTEEEPLKLPQTTTRELEEQLQLKPGMLMRADSVNRDSSRKSFVRNAMLDRHLKAQAQATHMSVVRQRTIRETRLKEQKDVSWKSKIRRCVLSSFVTNFIMAMIVFNAILLGVEIDVAAKLGENEIPGWFGIVNACLVLVFLTETLAKMFALGCQGFWKGDDWVWNTFDFVIVGISVAETAVDFWAQSMADGSQSFRVMRGLRLVRTLRGVRALRIFRYFNALRALILSIFSTMSSLMWTLMLLLIVFYTFSCIFVQLVTDHCRWITVDLTQDSNAVPVCPKELMPYWGTVMDSMLTLFMSITGGIDWQVAYAPLRDVGLLPLWLMNLYIVIGVLTILNVVTGVFVNTAIDSAEADKDIATLKALQTHSKNAQLFREIFIEMDETSQNQVSIEDLERALAEKKLSTFMDSLGISTDDIWGLFVLIDADHNGVVDMDEFVSGCMNLRGAAKSLQVAKMSYENKLTRQAIKDLIDDVAEVRYFIKKYTATTVREHL